MNVRRLSAAPRYEQGYRDVNRSSARKPSHLRRVTDEVILSARARAALEELRGEPEVASSIQSRMKADQLTDHRRQEVTGRIADGYYQQLDVARHVAYRMSSVLA